MNIFRHNRLSLRCSDYSSQFNELNVPTSVCSTATVSMCAVCGNMSTG
jgi:hypothetical protein